MSPYVPEVRHPPLPAIALPPTKQPNRIPRDCRAFNSQLVRPLMVQSLASFELIQSPVNTSTLNKSGTNQGQDQPPQLTYTSRPSAVPTGTMVVQRRPCTHKVKSVNTRRWAKV